MLRTIDQVATDQFRRFHTGGDTLLVKPPEFIQRDLPTIALIGDPLLEDNEGGTRRGCLLIFHGTEQWGNAREGTDLGEITGHLKIRIGPGFEMPEELHDAVRTEHDGSVALLGGAPCQLSG